MTMTMRTVMQLFPNLKKLKKKVLIFHQILNNQQKTLMSMTTNTPNKTSNNEKIMTFMSKQLMTKK